MTRFVVCEDGRILTSGYELGRIHHHPDLSSTHKPGKWFAVNADGILGLHTLRDRAVLQVVRESYPDATLLDLDFEGSAG